MYLQIARRQPPPPPTRLSNMCKSIMNIELFYTYSGPGVWCRQRAGDGYGDGRGAIRQTRMVPLLGCGDSWGRRQVDCVIRGYVMKTATGWYRGTFRPQMYTAVVPHGLLFFSPDRKLVYTVYVTHSRNPHDSAYGRMCMPTAAVSRNVSNYLAQTIGPSHFTAVLSWLGFFVQPWMASWKEDMFYW